MLCLQEGAGGTVWMHEVLAVCYAAWLSPQLGLEAQFALVHGLKRLAQQQQRGQQRQLSQCEEALAKAAARHAVRVGALHAQMESVTAELSSLRQQKAVCEQEVEAEGSCAKRAERRPKRKALTSLQKMEKVRRLLHCEPTCELHHYAQQLPRSTRRMAQAVLQVVQLASDGWHATLRADDVHRSLRAAVLTIRDDRERCKARSKLCRVEGAFDALGLHCGCVGQAVQARQVLYEELYGCSVEWSLVAPGTNGTVHGRHSVTVGGPVVCVWECTRALLGCVLMPAWCVVEGLEAAGWLGGRAAKLVREASEALPWRSHMSAVLDEARGLLE